MLREIATEGVVQNPPSWTPGVANVAEGDATQSSACSAN